jgi:signal peptidase I
MARSPLSWLPDVDESDPAPPGLPPFAVTSSRSSSSPLSSGNAAMLREIPILAVAAVLVAFLLRTFVFQAFFIPSPSMGCAQCEVHTLEIDDKILVSKLSYRLHPPHRGDIVVFECPATAVCNNRPSSTNPVARGVRWFGEHIGVVPPSTEDYIKRVIGLPGETVEVKDGYVLINGEPLIEPYLPPEIVTVASSYAHEQPYVVPAGHLWVMGDNRSNSSDSRVFQAIPVDTVVGRAIVRFWPPRRMGFL